MQKKKKSYWTVLEKIHFKNFPIWSHVNNIEKKLFDRFWENELLIFF